MSLLVKRIVMTRIMSLLVHMALLLWDNFLPDNGPELDFFPNCRGDEQAKGVLNM